MTKRLCVALAMTALVGATASGQTPAPSVDAIFKEFASDHVPGCAVGATRGDAPIFAKAYGMADLEHGVPLTPTSAFYMASVSKQFAALAILLLEQDGKLRLEDGVRTYVPELPDHAGAITIRQLLHHTSGLRDYLTLSGAAGHPSDRVITERDVLAMLARQSRVNFAPGTEHLYSNSGYVLLSFIVHRVSGRSLDAFARERIFTPLGMRSTRFQHDHASPISGRAIGYVKRDDAWRIANSMLDVVGDGGLYSTVEDMLRWAAAFERPEFAPLLARMATPGTLADGSAIANGYGMGLSAGAYRGVPTVSHGGSLAGYRTSFLRLPGEKLTVVVLCNTSTANSRSAHLVAEVHATTPLSAAPSAPAAPPPPPADSAVPRELAEALAGVYFSAELEATYRLVAGADGVTLQIGTNTPFALRLAGPDLLRGPQGLELRPVRDTAGTMTGFTISAGRGLRDLGFTKR